MRTVEQHLAGADRVRILHLEDDPLDARLLALKLDRGGLPAELERVDTLEAFKAAVRRAECSLILADYTVPGVDAFEALRFVREVSQDLPFIFVSGTIDEEQIVEALRRGATDYVLKQRLERLVPAVQRALHEQQERRQLEEARRALRQSEERSRLMIEAVQDYAIVMLSPDGTVVSWNAGAERVEGYTADEIVGQHFSRFFPPEDVELGEPQRALEIATTQGRFGEEGWRVRKGGARFWSSVVLTAMRDDTGHLLGFVKVARDVTERRRMEQALRESEQRLRGMFDCAAVGIIEVDCDDHIRAANERILQILGYTKEELLGRTVHEITAPEDQAVTDELNARIHEGTAISLSYEKRYVRRDGARVWVYVTVSGVRDAEGRWLRSIGTIDDITERKRAGEALHQSEAQFRQLADAMPQVVWTARPDGTVDYYNERVKELSGAWQRADGSWAWEAALHSDDVQPTLDAWTTAVETGTTYEITHRVKRADGTLHWYLSRGLPVRDAEGNVVKWFGTATDIDAQKAAEEALRESQSRLRRSQAWLEQERARLQAILDTIPVGLFMLESDGRTALINDEAKRIWAGSRALETIDDDAEYKGFWPDSGAPLSPEDWPSRQALLHGRTTKGLVLDIERFDGSRATVVASGAPIRDQGGNVVGSVAVNQDITELRRAKARLEEADRRKNEFLAMLSHELRNPLAPINNSLYILERAVPGGPQSQRAHQVIGRQVVHMTRLIEDLLDVTRISRGKIRIQRERVELCNLVARTVDDHRSMFNAAGVSLEVSSCSGPLSTVGDGTRLSQIIGNLLSNAVKFTPRGGHVELSLSSRQGSAVVRVIDDGAGIPPDLLEDLFEPFVQADTTLDRSKGGLGLGLALVKGLVELHGGRVSAHSAGLGHGSEFVIELPLATTDDRIDAMTHGSGSHDEGNRSLRVLLVEDNLDAAQTLKEALELNGHLVDVAATGYDGLQRARVFGPDVVLCDIGLPGMDGFEVARRMRADPAIRSAPLVALSGYAAPDDLERSREAGFVQHLVKPPDLAALEATLFEVSETWRRGQDPPYRGA